MICLGIDPDTKNTGIAVVEATGRDQFNVLFATTAAVPAKLSVQDRILRMRDAIERAMWNIDISKTFRIKRTAVEGQVMYPNSRTRPNDLIHLAQVAGMAAATCGYGDVWLPEPREWKGTVRKDVHQGRILRAVGLNTDLQDVPGTEGLTTTQKGHVIDAIGLAVWVAQQPARRKTA